MSSSSRILSFSGQTHQSGAVLDAVRRCIEDEGLSQQSVAREAGISASALNQWLLGKYQGDLPGMIERMSSWLNVHHEGVRKTGSGIREIPAWIETPAARQILALLTFVRQMLDIGVIYGGAGLGKTRTLEHYSTLYPNSWICTLSPATASVAACLEEIAIAVGLKEIPGRAARLQRVIIRRLKGTRGVLILDEAQHLFTSSLEAIRAIHDASGTALVLCGNDAVYARLTGGDRTASFAQLFSRIGKRLHLKRPLHGDVKALATASGITGSGEIKLLFEIAKKPGALRGVVKTIHLASVLALAGDGRVTQEHINAAWADLAGLYDDSDGEDDEADH